MSCNFEWISPDVLKNSNGVSFKVNCLTTIFQNIPNCKSSRPGRFENATKNHSDNLKSLPHTFIYKCSFL